MGIGFARGQGFGGLQLPLDLPQLLPLDASLGLGFGKVIRN